MIKQTILFVLTSIFISPYLFSQSVVEEEIGSILRYESRFSPFPHKNRDSGYFYKGEHYSAISHYSDSSFLVFIPNHLDSKDIIDLVFYFHGWRNNIDTSITQFNLIEQFYLSGKNGILILPESAKNSPDSFGGKFEERNIFKKFVSDILYQLRSRLGKDIRIGNISLAGHSGAYQVIAYILLHGGLTEQIGAIYLFDGLYGDLEKFTYWIDNYDGKFINIYTPYGGTVSESENLMICLESWNIPFELFESDNFSSADLKNSRIIFVKSKLGHNEVINTKNQFQKFLESSY